MTRPLAEAVEETSPPPSRRPRPRSTRACAARSPTCCSRSWTSPGRPRPTPPPWRRPASRRASSSTPEEVADIRGLVEAFGASPLCARLAAARDVRREAGFAFRLDPAGGALVNGFVDVLAREADGTMLIVDYKSDRLEGAEPEAVVEAGYATQRIVYALAALREGAPAVEVAYCFLERPEVAVGARFEPRDIDALAERLTRLAEGVLEGRHPVAAEPHRGLCGDCPGREKLCSWPQEMTLRELVPA